MVQGSKETTGYNLRLTKTLRLEILKAAGAKGMTMGEWILYAIAKTLGK